MARRGAASTVVQQSDPQPKSWISFKLDPSKALRVAPSDGTLCSHVGLQTKGQVRPLVELQLILFSSESKRQTA
jgi:hypothetical protein